jgi:hypothetical protein
MADGTAGALSGCKEYRSKNPLEVIELQVLFSFNSMILCRSYSVLACHSLSTSFAAETLLCSDLVQINNRNLVYMEEMKSKYEVGTQILALSASTGN